MGGSATAPQCPKQVTEVSGLLLDKLGKTYNLHESDLLTILDSSIHNEADLEKIVDYVLEKNTLSVLLYEVPIENWNILPTKALEAMYANLETKKNDLQQIGKFLDNRDTPRYLQLQSILGKTINA